MKRFIILLFTLTMLGSIAVAAPVRDITSLDARRIIAEEKPYLLDVRTPEEFRQARLQGAVLIPVNEIIARQGEIPHDRTILVYCAVGSRSGAVANYLAEHGFKRVYNMTDGIIGWYRNGLPIVR
jgi:rhodanese-related sulfurtransferase